MDSWSARDKFSKRSAALQALLSVIWSRRLNLRRAPVSAVITGLLAMALAGCGSDVRPKPTVTLQANPITITEGQSTTLTWSSTNTTSCKASGAWSGSEATKGTATETPGAAGTETYTLTCAAEDPDDTPSADASATVTVGAPPTPTVTISVSPTSIILGSGATLTWSSTNATSCTASGAWSGSEATSGKLAVTPSAAGSDIYTLSCTGAGGTAKNSATLTVTAPPAPTVTISAAPATITLGQSTTLTWSSTNATSCSATGAWSGSEATSGTATEKPGATGDASYELTCTGVGGNASSTAVVSVNAPAPTVTISVSPTTITLGANATLTWSSTNATSCTASGAWSGTEPTSGTATESPNAAGTNTYTLTCMGAGGSANDSATLTVNAPPSQAFVYTLNSVLNSYNKGNITAYSESASDGTLAVQSGSPYNTGLSDPEAIAVDQQMGLVFAIGGTGSGQSTGEIVAYTIDPTTGALSSMVTTTPPDIPSSLAVGPSGQFLYVTSHNSSTVMAYSIAAGGSLTQVGGSPFSVPALNCGAFCENTADAVAYDPQQQTLYVTMSYSWYVATFTVDPTTGVLTWVNNGTEVKCGPASATPDTTGTFIYITDNCGAAVNAYKATTTAVSGSNKTPLTAVPGSPFATGGQPISAVAEPSGKYLYVLNQGDNTISGFTIDSSTGALTQLSSSPFAITNGSTSPNTIVVDPSGKYLYVTSGLYNGNQGGVTEFSIDLTTGNLTQVGTTPFSMGPNASAPEDITIYKKPVPTS